MKQFLLAPGLLIVIVLICCKDKYQKSIQKPSATLIPHLQIKTDTTCIQDLPSLLDKDILLLNACSVIHSDSSSLSLQFKVAKGELDKQYNFQESSKNYARSGDTVIVKYIYITSCRGTKIRPSSIQLSNDTLTIDETIDWSGCKTRINESKAEEFYYTLLLKEKVSNLVVNRVGRAIFGKNLD